MSNFTPLVKFETTFDGDTVTMNLKRLKRKDILKIAPYLNGDTDADGEVSMKFDDQLQFAEVMASIIPHSVVNFSGLNDANGNAITVEDMVEEAYFQELVGEIMAQLFSVSKPSEADLKNSGAVQVGISTESNQEKIPSSADTALVTG